jgi:hypothetical protein
MAFAATQDLAPFLSIPELRWWQPWIGALRDCRIQDCRIQDYRIQDCRIQLQGLPTESAAAGFAKNSTLPFTPVSMARKPAWLST